MSETPGVPPKASQSKQTSRIKNTQETSPSLKVHNTSQSQNAIKLRQVRVKRSKDKSESK